LERPSEKDPPVETTGGAPGALKAPGDCQEKRGPSRRNDGWGTRKIRRDPSLTLFAQDDNGVAQKATGLHKRTAKSGCATKPGRSACAKADGPTRKDDVWGTRKTRRDPSLTLFAQDDNAVGASASRIHVKRNLRSSLRDSLRDSGQAG
jgi:hypothetical protein